VVAALTAIAEGRGIDLATLALAWLLAQGDDVVPLVGTSRASRLDEVAAAADVTLTAEELAAIAAAAPVGAASGDRYPSAYMPRLGL